MKTLFKRPTLFPATESCNFYCIIIFLFAHRKRRQFNLLLVTFDFAHSSIQCPKAHQLTIQSNNVLWQRWQIN